MKFFKFNPKRLFGSKDRSIFSRSDPCSFGSESSSSSDGVSAERKNVVPVGSITPTSVLPEVSGDFSEISLNSSPDLYLELVQALKLIDKDNDGVVSTQDLEALLIRLGPDPPSHEEINMMLSEVDRDDRGTISLEALASRVVSADLSRDSAELRETFEFFDADHDGLISAEELLRVFAAIGDDRCTVDDCRRMIAAVDEDGDGFVCFTEFSQMMHFER